MTESIASALAAPFEVDNVRWRIGGGPYWSDNRPTCMLLAYIDARDVMERLDRIVGAFSWQTKMEACPNGILCSLGIRIYTNKEESESAWIWKTDGAQYTTIEAFKGGCSEALRRAAVHHGIGRYLYALGDIDGFGYVRGVKQRRVGVPKTKDDNGEWWYFPPDTLIDQAKHILVGGNE